MAATVVGYLDAHFGAALDRARIAVARRQADQLKPQQALHCIEWYRRTAMLARGAELECRAWHRMNFYLTACKVLP